MAQPDEREQRTIFGEVAELYDRARPTYPEVLFDTVMEYGGLSAGDRAVEIGAGTGKATMPFAARGLDILALEPSPGMADVLRAKGVEAVASTFEDWVTTEEFPLLFAAQSWHWVPTEGRYEKALATLTPGGTIALFWNKPRQFTGEFYEQIDAIFQEHGPELRSGYGSFVKLLETPQELVAFADVTKHVFAWSQTYTSEQYVANQRTHSDHRLLSDERRNALHDAIADLIDAHGGTIDVYYDTLLFMGRRG